MFQHQRVFTREGWILTRSATPWDARVHQGKIGFSLPRRRLPLYFDDAKAAPRKGKSSRLKALGCCTSRQNSGVATSRSTAGSFVSGPDLDPAAAPLALMHDATYI